MLQQIQRQSVVRTSISPNKKEKIDIDPYKTCKFITKMIWKHYGKNEDQTHSYRNEWQKKISDFRCDQFE